MSRFPQEVKLDPSILKKDHRGVYPRTQFNEKSSPFLKEFDQFIIDHRIKSSLLFDKAGYDPKNFYMWKLGKSSPRLQVIEDLLEVMGLELCVRVKEKSD